MSHHHLRRIDRERVQTMVRDDRALVVEVLPRSAFEPLHLPGAMNIPLTDLHKKAVAQLDPSRPIIAYCYDSQ